MMPLVAAPAARPGDKIDTREMLSQQLAGEAATIASAQAIVGKKLEAADALRVTRVRAAYRVLHESAEDASPDRRMNTARRRAAARLLLARDASERGILADELAKLGTAGTRAAADASALATASMPPQILRPVRGAIARKFGVLEHERSKATLSRHGIDIEVEDHATVVAPADGTVLYAGPIRGLDRGLVIDHGTYLSVLAKLGDVAFPVGAPVHAGDRLARAARHRVYLEIRVKVGPGGLPVDPEPLFGKTR
jgi:septal ring factor EnvC (AmiA/AmiB activator)